MDPERFVWSFVATYTAIHAIAAGLAVVFVSTAAIRGRTQNFSFWAALVLTSVGAIWAVVAVALLVLPVTDQLVRVISLVGPENAAYIYASGAVAVLLAGPANMAANGWYGSDN